MIIRKNTKKALKKSNIKYQKQKTLIYENQLMKTVFENQQFEIL
jgi:hypothetical protein